jgi:hypothetical protein
MMFTKECIFKHDLFVKNLTQNVLRKVKYAVKITLFPWDCPFKIRMCLKKNSNPLAI